MRYAACARREVPRTISSRRSPAFATSWRRRGTPITASSSRGKVEAAASAGPRRGLQDWPRSAGERVPARPARSVELELDYAPNRLRMNVRDDGRGIDPAVASSGTRRALGPRRNARARGEDRRPIDDQEPRAAPARKWS